MKLLYYYFLIILPLVGCYFLMKENSSLGIASLFMYAFIYRPVVDFYKLKSNSENKKLKLQKMFIPFASGKYFKELYLS